MNEKSDQKCQQQALFRYTWPGRNESFICLDHALQLKGIAGAMGFPLQLIPLNVEDLIEKQCEQNVKEQKP